jgi:hypothetical protein
MSLARERAWEVLDAICQIRKGIRWGVTPLPEWHRKCYYLLFVWLA